MSKYDLSRFSILDLLPMAGATNIRKKSRNEYSSSCPVCGGKDRLHIHPDGGKGSSNPYAHCRRCGKVFDAISLTMLAYNIDFKQALARLGLSASASAFTPKKYTKKALKPAMRLADESEADVDEDLWQKRATTFCLECHEIFKYGDCRQERDYIHSKRGLLPHITDDPKVTLGYNPTSRYEAGDVWGLPKGEKVWLPKGYIIPYWQGNKVVKIKSRPHDGKPSKYISVKGGARDSVFAVSTPLAEADTAILVEGEFDALALWQALPRPTAISIIATGSTQGGRYLSLATELASVPHVWLAFDDDEAGRGASEAWLTQILHAQRLAPLAHDINDMLVSQGIHAIRHWLASSAVNIKPVRGERWRVTTTDTA